MKGLLILLCGLFLMAPAEAGEGATSDASPDLEELNASLRTFSEGLFLKKSAQVAQAKAQAQTRSDFGMELRPRVTDDDAGIALRIYLPALRHQGQLREQLEWVAQSEELRVAALEWEELLSVYRDFCSYRMLQKQIALLTEEVNFLQPSLARADQSVAQNELTIVDRAKLVSQYLDLLNNREKLEFEWIEVSRSLHQALGSAAGLDAFARIAVVELPTQVELDELFEVAVSNRADYQQGVVDAQVLDAAESIARAEDGFRFKYLQPAYNADYTGGEDTWGVSAAFVLPWGSQNPDIAEYREQRELADFELALQRRIMKDRLRSLLQASEALQGQMEDRNRLLQPVLEQLTGDLDQMSGSPFDLLRDRLQIRDRLLDAALQTAAVEYRREQLAVDFAEELGSLEP
jgi:hypothetical protein